MQSAIIHRSSHIKEDHLTIVVQADNQEDAEYMIMELKKAVHRMNHRMGNKVSFEIFKNIRRF